MDCELDENLFHDDEPDDPRTTGKGEEERLSEEDILKSIIKAKDLVVKMPPKKEYTIKVKIISIERRGKWVD